MTSALPEPLRAGARPMQPARTANVAAAERIKPAGRLDGLSAYVSPVPDQPIDLWLHANEGPPDGSIAWLRSLHAEISVADDTLAHLTSLGLHRYPDATEVERELADRFGIAPSQVLLTAGGDEAIARLMQAVLEPGRSLVVHEPTFVMIRHWARLCQSAIRQIPWMDEPAFPLEMCCAAVDASTAIVALVSPNNPTGSVITADDLQTVADAVRPGLVLLDHAYVEFAEHDLTAAALDLGNVVVIRTFSKARGLAGLRLGYALGPADVIGWMRAAGSPYPTSTLSLAAAMWSLGAEGEALLATTVQQTRSNRSRLLEIVRARGGSAIPSEGNFILMRVSRANEVRLVLARAGIAVRGFDGHHALNDRLRITVPAVAPDCDRLIAAIEDLPVDLMR